ncbi:casparian strip membrane protein 2-like [Phalaenopsis equestris]|uniref:casparian strip membrane protein 2-like n=1 Tax=Phalaenopsis equestris TaxID=78828 RepID=UPI0009E25DEA|nr:casparian strip membrane protein 2-like [Phalaenopsis equestris]
MNSTEAAAAPSTSITVGNGSADAAAGAAKPAAAPPYRIRLVRLVKREMKRPGGWKRSLACFDFFLRLLAIAAFVSAAVSMGTDSEMLPFFTKDFQFYADFADFPSLMFFVLADAAAAGYLAFSLLFSIFCIIKPLLTCPRLFLLTFDLLGVALTMAGASAAAAIVYLAHEGNSKANWVAFCMRFQGFCQQSSGAIIASFVGTILLMLMVALSALSLRRH